MRISDWSSDVCSSDLNRICLDERFDTINPAVEDIAILLSGKGNVDAGDECHTIPNLCRVLHAHRDLDIRRLGQCVALDVNLDARTQYLDPAVRRDSAREDTANAERDRKSTRLNSSH